MHHSLNAPVRENRLVLETGGIQGLWADLAPECRGGRTNFLCRNRWCRKPEPCARLSPLCFVIEAFARILADPRTQDIEFPVYARPERADTCKSHDIRRATNATRNQSRQIASHNMP